MRTTFRKIGYASVLGLLLLMMSSTPHISGSSAVVPAVPSSSPVEVLSGDNNYFLKINLRDSRVRLRVALANNDSGGLQSLSGIKNRFEGQGYAEWAIVNGDLFSPK